MSCFSVSSLRTISTYMLKVSTWSATTSASHQFEYLTWPDCRWISPAIVYDVHRARCCNGFRICGEAPHLVHGLILVWDTPWLHWEGLANLSLSAIRKLKSPPNYQEAIHNAIVLTHHCDPWSLPNQLTYMLATIYVPSIRLKHIVKYIFPQGSLV